jgi:hypothetical protein
MDAVVPIVRVVDGRLQQVAGAAVVKARAARREDKHQETDLQVRTLPYTTAHMHHTHMSAHITTDDAR